MRPPRPSALPLAIADLLRRLLRSAVPGKANAARRASHRPLTVIGQLRAATRLRAANDPDAR
jgi:hypothetical protein